MICIAKKFTRPKVSLQALKHRQITMVHIKNKVQNLSTLYDFKRFEDLYEKNVQLIPASRQATWRDQFQEIESDVVTAPGFEILKDTNSWVAEVLTYNTPHGKGIRAHQVILSDMYLSNDKSPENELTVNRLAWLMEMKQGAACVLDDIVDMSEMRRDRLCWYKVDNKGFNAYNDGRWLLNVPFMLLDKYFGSENFYKELFELFSFVIHAGMYGEGRDVRNAELHNHQMYNIEFYKDMMMFKNGYYTFFMPVAVAMIKNGISDRIKLKEVEKLSLEISLMYSIQDDFMDCFVDPKLTGKVGTDIEEGKCTWLFVNALERCSSKQRRVLLDNYRFKDPAKVDIIKRLYTSVGIPELYKTWEEETMIRILGEVGQLSITKLQPMFYDLLGALCGRVR